MKLTVHPRSRRALVAMGVGLSSLLVISGCAAGNTSDPGGDKTITIWTWKVPGAGLQAAADLYEKDHPNVKIDVQDVGNPAIWDKITTGMAAGGSGLPDVMNIGIDYIGSYLEKFPSSLANLSDLGGGDLESSFASGVWDSATRDGSVYGIPYEANTSGFFYRKDLFEAAGVDAESITSWDKLLEAGKKVKAATGVELFSMDKSASGGAKGDFFQLLMALQNSFYFNETGDITMNNDAGVAALTFLKEANDEGLVADIPGTYENLVAQINGSAEVAVLPAASWAAGTFEKEGAALKGKWAVRQPPEFNNGGLTAALTGGTYLSISNSSQNKGASYDFVKFALASEEGWAAVYKASGLFPAYNGIWSDAAFTEEDDYWGGSNPNQLFIAELKEKTPALNYTDDYANALQAFSNAQTQVLSQGADPKTALDAAAEQVAQQTGRQIAAQ